MIVPSKLRQLTQSVKGVIHVGMSWGEEIADYLEMGAMHVIGFEPIQKAFEAASLLYGNDPRVRLENLALGNQNLTGTMTVIEDKQPMIGHPVGTGGSTFLKELSIPQGTPERFFRHLLIQDIQRFDSWLEKHPDVQITDYDALVIDVQGMELQVLQGFGNLLNHFTYLNIECSAVPVYEGEAPAQVVIDYLADCGLKQRTPIEEHNDILFSK